MHGPRRGCVPPRTASSAADPLPAREPHGEEEHFAGPARHRIPHCPVAWPARPPHDGGLAPRAPRCGAPNKRRAPLGYFPAALPRPAPLTRVTKAEGEGGCAERYTKRPKDGGRLPQGARKRKPPSPRASPGDGPEDMTTCSSSRWTHRPASLAPRSRVGPTCIIPVAAAPAPIGGQQGFRVTPGCRGDLQC